MRLRVTVQMRQNATGETAEESDFVDVDEYGEPDFFKWRYGSMACDACRAEHFAYLKDIPPPDDHNDMDAENYSIRIVSAIDGNVLYDEWE